MQKTDVYVVLTNNVVNAVTMDPSVADQIKATTPNSVVKKYPMISNFRDGVGVVGEALEGDFDIGQDSEVADPDAAIEYDSEQDSGTQDENDVLCMDAALAIRMFEYVHDQQELSDESLAALVQTMIELGNASDNVLTVDHYDQLVGEQDVSDQEIDLDSAEDGDDDSQFDDQDEYDLEEDSFPGDGTQDAEFGPTEPTSDESDYTNTSMDQPDITAIGRFMAGEIDKQELISSLQGDVQSGQYSAEVPADQLSDEYADDQSDDFFQEAGPVGTTAPGQPQQVDPALDAQYMRGYNTGKQGGQAQQQNINTPQGSAYNSGFTAGKAGHPAVPPSKKTNESVDTFASFLKAVEKSSPVSKTVSSLFKQKKQQAASSESHFELEQDPLTSAVKITNK